MRRWKLLVVLVGLAAVVAAGVVALWPPPEPITPATLAIGSEGLSQSEAEAIFASVAKAVMFWPQLLAPGLSQENFDRVEAGMTRADVEALLGKPSRFHGGGLIVLPPSGVFPVTHPDWGFWTWHDPASVSPERGGTAPRGQWLYVLVTAASVSFDTSGRATSKYSEIFVVREPFSLPSLLWRAKRQWHRWFP